MSWRAYQFERFCQLTYLPFLIYVALKAPGYFGHLTYWTLSLHALYYTIDKSSPYTNQMIYALHGASFAGAVAVLIGYTFISIGGIYRFGSWLEWENAIGQRAGTVTHDRSFLELAAWKFYEHLWPVIAALIDVRLSRDSLKRAFEGAAKRRTTILAVGSYLVFGTVWEQVSKGTGKGSPLDVYMQPDGLSTTAILKQIGLENPNLPEDIFFTNAQKVCLIGGAFLAYSTFVTPLMQPLAKRSKKS
jgi:hypothetical protein